MKGLFALPIVHGAALGRRGKCPNAGRLLGPLRVTATEHGRNSKVPGPQECGYVIKSLSSASSSLDPVVSCLWN